MQDSDTRGSETDIESYSSKKNGEIKVSDTITNKNNNNKLAFNVGHKTRKQLFAKLRNEGNFLKSSQ